jgi:hypothetical protein
MTRRERLERKVERRQEWAEKREAKASATLNSQPELRRDWAFITQPGHIPERARMNARDDRAMESLAVAGHHREKAAGLERQLDRSIFSDDENAIGALETRIAKHEADRARMKEVNRLYRKGDATGLAALGLDIVQLGVSLAKLGNYFGQAPHMPYEMTNLGARIRADKERIKEVQSRQTRAREADEAGGVFIRRNVEANWCTVTFAEKPERPILEALRAAGYGWGGGSWSGYLDKLPEAVAALESPSPA